MPLQCQNMYWLSTHHAKKHISLHLDRPLLKTMTQSLKGKKTLRMCGLNTGELNYVCC